MQKTTTHPEFRQAHCGRTHLTFLIRRGCIGRSILTKSLNLQIAFVFSLARAWCRFFSGQKKFRTTLPLHDVACDRLRDGGRVFARQDTQTSNAGNVPLINIIKNLERPRPGFRPTHVAAVVRLCFGHDCFCFARALSFLFLTIDTWLHLWTKIKPSSMRPHTIIHSSKSILEITNHSNFYKA